MLEGVVEMYYGGADGIPTGIYTTSSFFGEIELLTNTDRHFTCLTLTKAMILSIGKREFQSIFFQKYPRLGKAFQEIMEIRNDGLRRVFEFVQKLILSGVGPSRVDSSISIQKIKPFHSKYSK